MSTLQYTVWDSASAVANGPVVNEQAISFTTPSAAGGLIDANGGNKPRYVRVCSNADCWVTWGESPVAKTDGTDGRILGAENPEYFYILANEKIAVIER